MRPLLPALSLLLLSACATAEAPRHVALADEHQGFAGCARVTQASWPGDAYKDLRAEKLAACLAKGGPEARLPVQVADRRGNTILPIQATDK
ncbi:hypothetical protein HHL28_05675 [Aerophototrophica crusticola]|uniref:Lipoprotein n=1 Tax=Aerophototrophica crusticola TaxID=1709002 RepID=A0A858R6I6_9PROT|nr:hypothetical protein HHL28_05675 [Rhodospirillaceae bacterium B3]